MPSGDRVIARDLVIGKDRAGTETVSGRPGHREIGSSEDRSIGKGEPNHKGHEGHKGEPELTGHHGVTAGPAASNMLGLI